jgi:peptide/nickel transport system permease protein
MWRALLRAAVLLLAVSVVVFAATEILPGDAADARTGGRATAAQLSRVRAEAGLDDPAWVRYGRWLGGLVRGDAGRSLLSDRPVADLVGQRLPATAALAGSALLVTAPLMLLLAWVAAGRRLGARVAAGLVTAVAALPQVVVAAALVALFSGVLAWLAPVSLLPPGRSPLDDPALLVLPVLSLALPAATYGAALLRGVICDVTARPHVTDAVLRGLPPWQVAARYVLPFLLAPAGRILAVVAGGLVASTTVVETLFGYTGLGELLVGAVANRDVPVVQAVAMLGAALVLTGLLAADVLATLADPDRGRAA